MIVVDGARGEGGGQILRASLALAAATGKPVRVVGIRAKRPNPGLAPQHASAVQALAEATDSVVAGARVGATEVEFKPGPPTGGNHEIHVPTAGSMTLVLQAILPVAAASAKPWFLDLRGGTDVLWAPTWSHFERVTLENLKSIGLETHAELGARGFYPIGGGSAKVEVHPSFLHPHDFTTRGTLRRVEGVVATSALPERIAERAEAAARERLYGALGHDVDLRFERARQDRPGKGMSIALRAVFDEAVLGADAVGKIGTPAEKVGDDAARRLVAEVEGGGAVDAFEADQLILWLALAGGGSLAVRGLTEHARTMLDLVPQFLDVRYDVDDSEPGRVVVRCS